MRTCASSEGARPSQKKCLLQARFHSDGVLRRKGAPESAERAPAPVRECLVGPMAGGAGALAVAGQARVGEEPRAQRDLVGSERIVGRSGGRMRRPLELLFPKRLDIAALRQG